jgi:hypothetical protein
MKNDNVTAVFFEIRYTGMHPLVSKDGGDVTSKF